MADTEAEDFAAWKAQMNTLPTSPQTDDEAKLGALRHLYQEGWTIAAGPCVICGEDTTWADGNGVLAHPMCKAAPPEISWPEVNVPAWEHLKGLRALLDQLRNPRR
jgi:hypothetical protein